MAPNDDSAQTGQETGEPGIRRRRAARYALPVAVAGVAAATIGLVPALAASGDPDLPKITAQELIEKIAASDTQQLSGSVKISTDLGLPDLGGLGGSFLSGGGPGGGHGGGPGGKDGAEGKEGSSAAPDAKLAQLATGSHILRVAIDGPERQKVSIVEKTSEYSLIRNGDEVWGYDSGSNEVFHHKGAGTGAGDKEKKAAAPKELPTPKVLAEEVLKAAEGTTSVTVDGTAKVAGRSAYQLVVKPEQSGSTIGSVRIAVDSKTGTPLKFSVIPASGGKAAVDIGFTKVDFAAPAASTFDFAPPKGAKVKDAEELRKEAEKAGKAGEKDGLGHGAGFGGLNKLGGAGGPGGAKVIGEGWTTIARIGSPAGPGTDLPKGGGLPPEADKFLGSFGDSVSGKFGSGTVFKTRLVNALMTDDGTVYVGAVTKDALVKAANGDR
ncbi:LolA family protein [Streptomyces qinzhouensis]|uniref:Outer membrane lipoprotein carrier protein LolA n=1 Tax=Streptomyces qinzhouensis TaxID=2599401 RepID=A0A5B8JAN8_9ACTN|nr:outer membrane lipoprotein carrier protein LolA [Streptomyces qinzhouensis]QDY78447.1 outer membrane lipoprotein carrier protein LolA [Streptomyces qinzhouensis]